jgi:ATP-dependent exoDNAse (exonuclease V) beta subunit
VNKSGWIVEENGGTVPIESRHICILFRRLRNFSADVTRPYVRALEARRLPHVLVGGRSFHDREEIVALRNALTAIEWPDDELRVYATLRGPLFAFSDDALFVYRQTLNADGELQLRRLHPRPSRPGCNLLGAIRRARSGSGVFIEAERRPVKRVQRFDCVSACVRLRAEARH